MKVKKVEDILLYIGVGAMLFGLVLFGIAPIFGDEQFVYDGFLALGLGFINLFTFRSPVSMLLFFLFIISIICLLLWLGQLARKDSEKESWIKFIACIFTVFVIFAIASGMFATKIEFNGEETILIEAINEASGNGTPKLLAMLSIAFAYLSLMLVTLYAFVNFGFLNFEGPFYRKKLLFVNKEEREDADNE